MRPGYVVVALAFLLLSGCSGPAEEAESSLPSTSETASDPPSPNETVPDDTFVPKFHTHDYWAGRPDLFLFGPDARVPIGQDPIDESYVSTDSVVMGRTDFDTEWDGDDSGLQADRTDVVYQGTSRIEVTAKWTDTNKIPGLLFYFKHASTPLFTSLGPVNSGQPYYIELKQYWADMPHQLALSRWKFRIEAFNPATGTYPVHANYAQGDVLITMKIYNGGERFIDPPHPYFFTQGPTRYAGEVNATLSKCIIVNNTKNSVVPVPLTNSYGFGCPTPRGADDFKVAPPQIIPWETTRVIIEFFYNITGEARSAYAPKLGLKLHASDGDTYRYPKGEDVGPGHIRYEVGVSEVMTDSPYATQSDWRFGVYPIIQDQRDWGGEIDANLHIHVTAVNDGSSGRGMGN